MREKSLRRDRSPGRYPKTSKRTAKPIATTGEIFHYGTMIEPVRDDSGAGGMKLLFWDGKKATISRQIPHDGQIYEAAAIHPTVLRDLTLATKSASSGSARQLLADMSRVLTEYTDFPEHAVTGAARVALATWFLGTQTAPRLSIIGPETLGVSNFFSCCTACVGIP